MDDVEHILRRMHHVAEWALRSLLPRLCANCVERLQQLAAQRERRTQLTGQSAQYWTKVVAHAVRAVAAEQDDRAQATVINDLAKAFDSFGQADAMRRHYKAFFTTDDAARLDAEQQEGVAKAYVVLFPDNPAGLLAELYEWPGGDEFFLPPESLAAPADWRPAEAIPEDYYALNATRRPRPR